MVLPQERLPNCGDFHLLRSGALVSDGGGDHRGGFAAACAESINAIIFTRLWPSVLKVRLIYTIRLLSLRARRTRADVV